MYEDSKNEQVTLGRNYSLVKGAETLGAEKPDSPAYYIHVCGPGKSLFSYVSCENSNISLFTDGFRANRTCVLHSFHSRNGEEKEAFYGILLVHLSLRVIVLNSESCLSPSSDKAHTS